MSTGSGAGLNRVSATILTVQGTATAAGTPLSSYGTIGVNDSGLCLVEAHDFTKWSFSMVGNGTNMTVSLYGTNDPIALAAWRQAFNPGAYPAGVATLPASSWFLLPGPNEQSGTGGIANPLVAGTSSYFQYSGTLIGVRAVLTTAAAPTGSMRINVQATP